MKKEFITNIFFLMLINLIIKPFYIFGIESQVQQKVGDAAFGLYFSLYGLVFLHQFINDPGLQNFNSIYIAQHREAIGNHLPRIIGLKLQLLLVMILSISLSAWLLQYDVKDFMVLMGIILVLFLSSLFVLLRSSLSSLGKYHYDTWISGADRLLLVIILGIMLMRNEALSVQGFVAIQIGVYAFCSFAVLIILGSKVGSLIPVIDMKYSIQLLKKCLPYALIILLTAIIMRADGVIIERWLVDGSRQAGVYAKGYRFMDAANMFGYLFGALLLPMYAHKLNDKKAIGELFHLAHNLLLYLSVFIGCGFFVYRAEIFQLLYSDMNIYEIQSLMPLMWAIIPVAMTNVYGPLILASHHTRAYNLVFVAGVCIYLLSNLFYVPQFGIVAAATTALVTWSILLMGMALIIFKNRLIFFERTLIWHSLAIIIIVGVAFYFTSMMDLAWVWKIIATGIISLTMVLLLGIIKYDVFYKKEGFEEKRS